MNKDVVLSLIKVLKTLKNIMIKHNETFRNYLDLRSMATTNRILSQGERFKKITEDINSLMKKTLSQKEFESYIEDSKRMLGELSQREVSINEQVKTVVNEFQLNLKGFKEKIMEFDDILNEIKDRY
ncbi:MAG: hypothetical protein E3J90_03930 [Promethearchaeota archaeon]|nr:MAG: hypothetical protein E3J90_03930 [Candidatus Lokiarchaeota archaeon]